MQIIKYSIGSGQRSVFLTRISHPRGMAIHGSYFYFTDRDYETINVVDLATGENHRVLRNNLRNVGALKWYYERPKGMYDWG